MILLQLTLQTYPRTLQKHGISLNGVPCAYFMVSLRVCAIHSSGWVDFADFGLVGFGFFCSISKKMRALVLETTACLRCYWVSLKLAL
jgi:hypothetical protein